MLWCACLCVEFVLWMYGFCLMLAFCLYCYCIGLCLCCAGATAGSFLIVSVVSMLPLSWNAVPGNTPETSWGGPRPAMVGLSACGNRSIPGAFRRVQAAATGLVACMLPFRCNRLIAGCSQTHFQTSQLRTANNLCSFTEMVQTFMSRLAPTTPRGRGNLTAF